ncbi:hypothetical protein Ari01nite_91340 [Paractinoplanes rishiriensis]|uniref:NB-ARC domain-containing protein n=1 Tax=Paractinoplanes rishiriensis TaxID=1050105 RepID=A0A919K8I3_9ACTN|nr:hypothetical protein Ari01nite_91340 [Actinoplanes rishiriensis]
MERFTELPDPAQASCLDEVIERLRLLKVWAGDPSYETIKNRVNAAWVAAGRPASELTRRTTVAHCFQPGRRRLNTDLVLAVVEALRPDARYVARWRQSLRVVGGEIEAASQVRVQEGLPDGSAGFVGRAAELDELCKAVRSAAHVGAIEGMAGAGKTQLALHAGHRLLREHAFDRVLFVNLRGFHPDPVQPPADPAAVLDEFLRLLGVPGHQIPHDLTARVAAYRERLAGLRALVVLDNAAGAEQVRPLVPAVPGCVTLVTSRRSLAGLRPSTRLTIEMFTREEARAFLAGALPGHPVGTDPAAADRIAARCGNLPLALSLIAGHVRNIPGWTLTDHADRLDERRHRQQPLDGGVDLALRLSYQHLPAERQRLLRLAALHPAQDFDGYAAAALAGTDLATVRTWLDHLRSDHLLQEARSGRYAFHDLVRSFAADQARDQDRPAERRAALTRLADYYLAVSAAAMDVLDPAERHWRPRVPQADTPVPALSDPDAAIAWLNTERSTLVAVAVNAAANGRPSHTVRLSQTLCHYLNDNGRHADAVTVHSQAQHAAQRTGDRAGQAHALRDLGYTYLTLGQHERASAHLEQALDLFRQIDNPFGQARAMTSLGYVADRSGDYPKAIAYKQHALRLYQQICDSTGQTRALLSLGISLRRSGRLAEAGDCYQQTLALARQAGDRRTEASTLNNLGVVETMSGRYDTAQRHLERALTLYREFTSRTGEAHALDNLGLLHNRRGRPEAAIGCHQRALDIFREAGDRECEAWVLNSLGEATHSAGRATDAIAHHTAARAVATAIGARDEQARAHAGLGRAHHTMGDTGQAREQYRHAVTLYTGLGVPEADEVSARLAELDQVVESRMA